MEDSLYIRKVKARAAYNRGKDKEAIELFTGIINEDNDPEDLGEAHNLRGMSYHLTGNKDKAIADFKKAIDYGYHKAIENLKEHYNITYTPQKPSSSPPPSSGSSSPSGSTTPNGRLTLINGSIYEGNIVDGRGTGKGRLILKNGDIIECDTFENGRAIGKIKIKYANGDILEGTMPFFGAGSGKMTYKNGRVKEGSIDFALKFLG